MKTIHVPIVCFTIFVVLSPACFLVHAAGSNDVKASLKDFITDRRRGIKIDFTPPLIVQEAGSFFILNVTLSHVKIRPVVFSLSVYLNLKNEFGWNHTVKIGSKPYVFFPPGQGSITVAIPCFTQHNLAANINAMFAGEASHFNVSKAWIGVKIDKLGAWFVQDCFWEFLVTDKIDAKQWSEWSTQETQRFISFLELISNLWKNSGGFAKIRVLSSASILMNLLRPHFPLIVWKNTSVLPAFVCCSRIKMKASIENRTDANGNFKVRVNITNNLPVNVHVQVLVDMSDQSIFNTLLPVFKGQTMYNLGFLATTLNSSETKNRTILCSFPDKGFDKKKYNITVEFGPYIPIGNTSLWGIFFYDFRWKMLVKPYYIVNGSVSNSIQELWFNAPIFYGETPGGQIFQDNHSQILYTGKTSTDIAINQITNSLFEQPLLLILIIFLIGAPYILVILLIYVIVQKTIREKK